MRNDGKRKKKKGDGGKNMDRKSRNHKKEKETCRLIKIMKMRIKQ